ncbi:YqjK-like protein [Chromohalobacter marismortui]|uniref:YqjK-like protein n=1 Tax=Chromohalobacter marismortui TaxID=42055 RepID=A0A4R7NUR3_9GAMM|nr:MULTISPECIES: YqjK-like family protein [Chromohalobacter]MCI0510540.1 YqjK-like family protein [Chromohalobacter sp.]MCI0594107.1 YqjK-like family protein [Chromohalobacter sp.]TDU24884.1 YqjK-like protein [Chromohalobacter marismortui]
MNRRERAAELEYLETRILQQRLDMGHALHDWRDATAPIDHGWQRVMQWRAPLLGSFGLLAAQGARRPRTTRTWLRRGLSAFLLFNRARSMYRLARR